VLDFREAQGLHHRGHVHPELVFDIVSIDGQPDSFKDVRWKSFIRKYSEDEIGEGLEVSKKGEPFRLYGESRARKVA
jgi:hypothetical protein